MYTLWGKPYDRDAFEEGMPWRACSPRSAAVTSPAACAGVTRPGPLTRASAHWAESTLAWPGPAWPGVSWESEPCLKGALGALEKQRRFLLHFS